MLAPHHKDEWIFKELRRIEPRRQLVCVADKQINSAFVQSWDVLRLGHRPDMNSNHLSVVAKKR